jgi:hypothetical protein
VRNNIYNSNVYALTNERTPPLVISSITITGLSEVMEESSSQYSCIAYYNDGSSQDVTTLVSWSEDSPYALDKATFIL